VRWWLLPSPFFISLGIPIFISAPHFPAIFKIFKKLIHYNTPKKLKCQMDVVVQYLGTIPAKI